MAAALRTNRFSKLVADEELRKTFIESAVHFLRQHSFDGLDLDWEYPTFREGSSLQDKEGYAKFIQVRYLICFLSLPTSPLYSRMCSELPARNPAKPTEPAHREITSSALHQQASSGRLPAFFLYLPCLLDIHSAAPISISSFD